jgi:hypothetical protein
MNLPGLRGAAPISEESRWQKQYRTEQREQCGKAEASEAQRQCEQPNYGRDSQRHKCNWPCEHEQDAPGDEQNEQLHQLIPPPIRGFVIFCLLCRVEI